jgi:arginine exporter protein ArgO
VPETISALLLGVVAGLGVAVPLGAVGVLVLRTGLTSGWRIAAAGALGVASVDLAYAVVATVAGSAVAALLAGHEHAVRLAGAAVLCALAARGLWRAWKARRTRGADPDPATDRPGAVRAGAAWARFVGLTALNPLTVVYFAVVAAGLATRWVGAVERVAFVLGVAAASAAWQLVLAGLGAFAGSRARPGVRLVMGVLGDVVVLGLAAALALG